MRCFSSPKRRPDSSLQHQKGSDSSKRSVFSIRPTFRTSPFPNMVLLLSKIFSPQKSWLFFYPTFPRNVRAAAFSWLCWWVASSLWCSWGAVAPYSVKATPSPPWRRIWRWRKSAFSRLERWYGLVGTF